MSAIQHYPSLDSPRLPRLSAAKFVRYRPNPASAILPIEIHHSFIHHGAQEYQVLELLPKRAQLLPLRRRRPHEARQAQNAAPHERAEKLLGDSIVRSTDIDTSSSSREIHAVFLAEYALSKCFGADYMTAVLDHVTALFTVAAVEESPPSRGVYAGGGSATMAATVESSRSPPVLSPDLLELFLLGS